jgi:tetratricopeptide (TPR) repeat protein
MKTAMRMIGLLLVLIGTQASWVQLPIEKGLSAMRLPLTESAGSSLTYGIVALIATFAAGAAWIARNHTLPGWIGAGLILLSLTAPIQIGAKGAGLLDRITDEHGQHRKMLRFSHAYLLPNLGTEPDFTPELDTATLTGRLLTAVSFMGMGWTFTLAGGFMLLILTWADPSSQRAHTTALLIAGLVGSLLIPVTLGWRPWLAEAALNRAREIKSAKHAEAALPYYEKAIRLDQWHRTKPDAIREMGELHSRMSKADTAAYHLYKGSLLEHEGQRETALHEYELAADDPALPSIGRREQVRLAVEVGLIRYSRSDPQSAVTIWEAANRLDPDRIEPLYYMARAYYDLSRYEDAVRINELLLSRVSQSQLRAHVYANLGDCYQRMGNPQKAREQYTLSMRADPHQNYRALMSLVSSPDP